MTYTINIKDAHRAALGAYETRFGLDQTTTFFKERNTELTENFDFSGFKDFRSKTGAFFHAKSGFGLAALGKSNSTKHEAVLAFRGTKTVADGLTDFNAGMQLTKSGQIVHAGFNRAFNELAPQLKSFFAQHSVNTIHCIGHSLGGGIATLAAEHLTHFGIANTKLYTIGAPRVGFAPFAKKLTNNLGSENIYRLNHHNDIVTMMPTWPYTHVPQPGTSCRIHTCRFDFRYSHFMPSYGLSIESVKDWQSLRAPEPIIESPQVVQNWLSLEGAMHLSTSTLSMIGVAIGYILKAACIGVNAMIMGGATILDKLSYIMHAAYDTSKEVAGWVTLLLQKILKLFGKTIDKTQKITTQFIRWVFGLLHGAVARIVRVALAAVG